MDSGSSSAWLAWRERAACWVTSRSRTRASRHGRAPSASNCPFLSCTHSIWSELHATSGEAKFWLEPRIELAQNYGLTMRQVNAALRLIQEHEDEIRKAWKTHFGR